jgi:hypothetical protein
VFGRVKVFGDVIGVAKVHSAGIFQFGAKSRVLGGGFADYVTCTHHKKDRFPHPDLLSPNRTTQDHR